MVGWLVSWFTVFLEFGSKDFLAFAHKVRSFYKEKSYRARLADKNHQIFFGALLCPKMRFFGIFSRTREHFWLKLDD